MRNPFRRRAKGGPGVPSYDDLLAKIEKRPVPGPKSEGLDSWRRVSHWAVVFAPQGWIFARFDLLPSGEWRYSQPGNAGHEAMPHTSIETLMAQAELDWAAHSQVLRQADEHIDLYNRRWFLPKA